MNGTLARRISLPLLTLYGLGTILGAGIYVLIGKVVGSAGMLAPLSFLLAAIVAWVTALSYSQLAVIFPYSAGEAIYVEHGFQRNWLTISVGILVIFTGIVSSATLANGFIGYFKLFIPISDLTGISAIVILLTVIACIGIAESLLVAGLITLLEILGLILILWFCGDVLFTFPERIQQAFLPTSYTASIGIFSGAFLAFYAFIGFEDMVNVAEEVKEPHRTMPKAILLALIIATFLYILISLIAVLSLPIHTLAESDAPLALLFQNSRWLDARTIAAISIIAIVNGILIQIIMASRVIYGMARRHINWAFLAYVNPKTKTPLLATIVVAIVILLFALVLPLQTLAKLTSFIILIIFSCVNLSLWKLKSQKNNAYTLTQKTYPITGALLCLGLLISQLLIIF